MDRYDAPVAMQFGIQIEPQFGFTFEDVRDIAVEAETLGLDGLWVSDHLFLNEHSARTDCLEAWTLLAALTQHTTRLRLGAMVTAVSYRNPALLAKIAAGVDRMSGGRLEFGIGAGWKEVEYRAYGYAFPPAGTRIEQLVEAIEICTRLWTEERATYRGTHYLIEGAPSAPKPVQRPRPPIWIGGSKSRMLRVMAKYADAVNIGGFPSLADYTAATRGLDEACRAIRRDPRAIRRSHFVMTILGETRREVEAVLDELAGRAKTTREEWRSARPALIIGTPEEVVERLRAFAKAGCSYFLPMFPYGHEREMLRVLARQVVPALREG